MNLIYGFISSYYYILNSPEWLDMIKKVKKLASVIGDIYSEQLGAKEDRNKRKMEAEDQRKEKSEQKQMGEDEKRLKGLDNFEVFVCLVLAFGMDHINNLKVKDLRVMLRYHLGSEKFKGGPNKVELV